MLSEDSERTSERNETNDGISRRAVLASTSVASVGALVGAVGSASASQCDYAIRPVVAPDVGYKRDRTVDAVNNLAEEIEESTNKSVNTLSLYETDESPTNYDSECEWYEAVAIDLYDNFKLVNNDMFLAGHKIADWGYGRSCSAHVSPNAEDSYNAYGGVHYVDQTEYRIATSIGIQELGHGKPWFANHGHGDVDTNGDTVIEVSPMATSYVLDQNGNCDTDACSGCIPGSNDICCGGDSPPNAFCDGTDNGSFDGFRCEVHTSNEISDCYETQIKDDAGNFSDRC
jgi:hypothetical protein